MYPYILLSIICLLVPPRQQLFHDEPRLAAVERYATIALAVAQQARTAAEAAFLLSVAKHESHFVRSVHDGTQRGDGGMAWGLFQRNVSERGDAPALHADGPRLRDIVGCDLESTTAAVRVALAMLRPRIRSCRGRPDCTFRLYGGIRPDAEVSEKTAKRLAARVATYRRIRRLMAAWSKRIAAEALLRRPAKGDDN